MKEQKETQLAKTETKPAAVNTPFGFMRRFATDMERLFEEFEGLRFPGLFEKEFFPQFFSVYYEQDNPRYDNDSACYLGH